ncbi:MAG: hypothetical protein [Cressdnaviricota sp.]|nr:MAG: hypothetical protein [Cressdnaviricota sp.]
MAVLGNRRHIKELLFLVGATYGVHWRDWVRRVFHSLRTLHNGTAHRLSLRVSLTLIRRRLCSLTNVRHTYMCLITGCLMLCKKMAKSQASFVPHTTYLW